MTPAVSGKGGTLPRSVFWLAAILVLAVAVLVYLRSRPDPPDFTLGGVLLQTPAENIDGLLMTRGGAQYRLDRLPSGEWTLSGAVEDYLDRRAVERLLGQLATATGGRLLPGSEPEDRRYDFNGPAAMRLTVFADDGSSEKLAVGAQNPVTGGWYASGAGRSACFPISDGLHEVLRGVPETQRLDRLLPLKDAADVQRVEIARGETTDVLARKHGRWFLRAPAEGPAALGAPYLAYAAHYGDRVLEDAQGRWILAADEKVGLQIYECSQVAVKRILQPGDAARLLSAGDGGPPWRRVRLLGAGINPDPGEGSPDELEITYLTASDAGSQPMRRRSTVLLAEVEAANTISQPLAHLVDMGALGFRPGVADSLHVLREGELLFRAHRDEAGSALPRRIQRRPVDYWLLDEPALKQTGQDPLAHHNRATHFLVDLDRTPILKTLPPSTAGHVLQDRERLTLMFFLPEGEKLPGVARGRVEVQVGFLDLERLPEGSPEPALPTDNLEPVGMWWPATGKLLQITGHPITTARAWAVR